MDVAEPRVAEIDAEDCVWCSYVDRLTVECWMNEEQGWRFACAQLISLLPLASQLERRDVSVGCWDYQALVEMKVSAWTDAQESARVERARTSELLRSDARLGKVQALERAQVWRLTYLSQLVPYSHPC
jgi:hypothetical protein